MSIKRFTKAFEKATLHNSQSEKKKSFQITYKKLNGRTVKRKIDPGTIKNGLVIAYDHKRKAIRSFKLDRVKNMNEIKDIIGKRFEKGVGKKKEADMNKVASFIEGFEKQSENFAHGAELAGLGILAAPSVKKIVTGKSMSEKNQHRAELAGLGVLAAPSVAHFAKGFMNKAKKAV